jgi:hypothetical protein
LHHPGRIISDNLVSDAYSLWTYLIVACPVKAIRGPFMQTTSFVGLKSADLFPLLGSLKKGLIGIPVWAGAVAAMLLLSATAAFANPITTFNLTSTFSSEIGAAYGTITICRDRRGGLAYDSASTGSVASALEVASLVGPGVVWWRIRDDNYLHECELCGTGA